MTRAVVIIVLAVAATGCRSGGKEPPPLGAQVSLADSADQTMYGARSVLTDRGLLRADLVADTAYFFDENTRIEMRNVHTTFYGSTGAKNATLTSKAGTYNTRGGVMEARGNVVVISEDGRRLTGQQLRYDQTRNLISSDSAFVLTEPGRELEGVGFTSDPSLNNIRVLHPTRGTTSGGVAPTP